MFDTVTQDVIALLAISALWFHFGRTIGIRVGYLRGRRAVREYYATKERERV